MSSWLRTAVNKAVEVGGKTNIRRAVRTIADSVSHQSASNNHVVVDRIFHDRNVAKDSRSFKHAAKRLEEASVSCRGVERVQLLRRWLVALKEIDRLQLYNGDFFEDDEFKDSFRAPTIAYYYDSDDGGDPRNFRDVFLHSQALEGMVLSMILKAPNEEEVSLLMEIFRLCLTGGKEVHIAVMKSIQELAEAFLSYEDEVLVKREELLQYAQDAIAGLKLSADLARVDAEAYSIKEDLDKMKELHNFSGEVEEKSTATTEDLKEALVQVQSFAKLESLLLRKKTLCNGDTPKLHAQKLDKLKVLLESLANSTTKAEKRISEQRYQKEEALNFRITKASEMSQSEKDLQVEIQELQKRRDELEEELKKVNNSLSAAYARLQNSREEKEQFDEASNQILVLLKSKEDELSRAIASYKKEENIVKTWIRFLEGTWVLQTSHTEQQKKEVDGELERYGSEFVSFVINLLSHYKSELLHSVSCFGEVVNNLHSSQGSELEHENDREKAEPRKLLKNLEQELVEAETKFLTTSSVVDAVRKQFYAQNQGVMRKDEQKVKELFDALEKIKEDFESIERPTTRSDTQGQRLETPSDDRVLTHSFFVSEHEKQTTDHRPDEICALDEKAKQGHLGSEYTLDKEARGGNLEYEHTSENEAKPENLESNTLGKEGKSGNLESRHTLDNDVKMVYLQSECKLDKVAKPEIMEYEHTLEKEVKQGYMETSTLDYEEKSGNLNSEYTLEEDAGSENGESKTLDNEAESGNPESEYRNINRGSLLDKMDIPTEEASMLSDYEFSGSPLCSLEQATGSAEHEQEVNKSSSFDEVKPYDARDEPGNLVAALQKTSNDSANEIETTSQSLLTLYDDETSISPVPTPQLTPHNSEHGENEVVKFFSIEEEKTLDSREKTGNLVAEPQKTSSDLVVGIETTSQQSLPALNDDKTSVSPVPTPQHTPQTSEHRENEFAEFFSMEEEKPLDAREKSGNLEVLHDDETCTSPVPTPQHMSQTSGAKQDEFANLFITEEEKPLDAREKPGNLEARSGMTCDDITDGIGTTNQSLYTQYDDANSATPVYTPLNTPQTSEHEQDEFADFYSSEEEMELHDMEKQEYTDSEPGKISMDSLMDDTENQSQNLPAKSDDRIREITLKREHTAQTYEHEKGGKPVTQAEKVIMDSSIDAVETPSQKIQETADEKISLGTTNTEHTTKTYEHGEDKVAKPSFIEEDKEATGSIAKHDN